MRKELPKPRETEPKGKAHAKPAAKKGTLKRPASAMDGGTAPKPELARLQTSCVIMVRFFLFCPGEAKGETAGPEDVPLKLQNPSWHTKNMNWCIKKSGGKQLLTVA